MKIVEASNLCKNFNIGKQEYRVIKNISFAISKGSFVSIMGPSGGGKSTLLYLLGGLDEPTSGSVFLKERNLSDVKSKELSKMRRRELGFVFQFYNLVPNLSVQDNVLLPFMLDGQRLRDKKEKLDDILKFIGLYDKKDLTPRELSGGQQQRTAIARSLIYEPDILFLDEPIGNLDSKNGIEIMKLFQKINVELHKTIIQVTHSEEAALYGTHIFRLVDGEITSIEEVNRT